MALRTRRFIMPVVLAVVAALMVATNVSGSASASAHRFRPPEVRFATFNTVLSDNAWTPEVFVDLLASGDFEQAELVAEVLQRTRPDVVLLNEFNFVPGGEAVELFRDNFLEVSQNGAEPIDYPYYYLAPVNTGVASGYDLDNNGVVDTTAGDFSYAGDAWGFGLYPGQYGMVVLSQYPIDSEDARTFQLFRWEDMPGNLMPTDFYSEAEQADFRLSSKSHWDVPIEIGAATVHLLAAHPTPPVFDGPEDRNGRRNHDEIRFWADYIRPGRSRYIYDDSGRQGGLAPGARFVIAGDYNADPFDGDATGDPADLLADSPRVNDSVTPSSVGGVLDSAADGGINDSHVANPAYDTADFGEPPGNLRVDYVLPSKHLRITDAQVFWPTPDDDLAYLANVSDHHLVWVDVRVPRGRRR